MEKKEYKLEKYKIMIAARNFHYENFNKWSSYFYVAIGALFVGYYTIKGSNTSMEDKNLIIIMLLTLGFIFSLLWYWSNKGFYYWNINFITLVNNYEKKVLKWRKNKAIYSVFANKNEQNDYSNPLKGANISTSKIAILFAFIVTVFWGILFISELNNIYKCFRISFLDIIFWGGLVIIFIIASLSEILAKKYLYSYIEHMLDLKVKQDPIK